MLKQSLIVFTLIVIIALNFAIKNIQSIPVPDGYARYAYSIDTWGVYGVAQSSSEKPKPSIGRAPLYPYFLAGMMQLSPTYKQLVKNYLDRKSNYDKDAHIVPYVQMALMGIVGVIIFITARLFGSNPFFAYGVMVIALIPLMGIPYRYRLSENLSIPLFAISNLFVVLWYQYRAKLVYLFWAGVFLGLVALTRVVHLYYLPLLLMFIALIPPASLVAEGFTIKRKLLACSVVTIGMLMAVGPWLGRSISQNNSANFGASGTYAVLAVRAEMNQMTILEAFGGSIYLLPVFGNNLAKNYLPKAAWERFDFDNPDGFRSQSRSTIRKINAPDTTTLKIRLYQQIFSNPAGYVISMIPLSIRGLRNSLPFMPFVLFAVFAMRYSGRKTELRTLMAASALTIITFVIHVGITHFRARYGLPMLIGFAPLAAVGLTYLFKPALWRSRQSS